MLMCPELSCSSNTRLYFIDDHEDVVFLCQFTQATEESGRSVVVSSFCLDWFDDYSAGWEMMRCD